MKTRTVTPSLVTVVLTISFLLCLAVPAGAITNGTNDSGHPYVCLVQLADDWRVTGVQLSPTVVLTAGHGTAGYSSAKVWFSAQPDMSTPEAVATNLSTYPGYAADLGDVGIVTLPTPHPLSEYAQLPGIGDVDELPMLQAVDLVGYGANYEARGGGTPVWQWLNVRQQAPAQLIQSANGWTAQYLKVTANPADGKGGIAFGDSGGPVLRADTNVVLGVNTFVMSSNCTGVTYAQRVDLADVQEWVQGFLN